MDSLDLTTLRLLKYRSRFENMRRAIPTRALDTRTQVLLSDYARFFRDFPDAQRIDRGAFGMMFRMVHPKFSEDDYAIFDRLFEDIDEDVPAEVEQGLMKRLMEAATAFDIASMLEKYQAGEEVDIRQGITGFIEAYDAMVDRKIKNPQVLDAIEDLLLADQNHAGLSWRLGCLNRSIKPLVGGDFLVVAARPDKGKTTFLSDQLTHMAPQIDVFWPGENRSILWFNNEGPGKRIVTRNFQSALNATTEEMVAMAAEPAEPGYERYKSLLRQRYVQALGGRAGVLRVFDIHEFWNHEVEDLIKLHTPGLIVFDMIDNIRFGGDVNNNGQRTDQLLESMYQWARVRGVKYDCPVIATSQLSADADGEAYPTLPQLKDSKTGKQGAADVIITLGASNDPALESSRYIGTTKNKKAPTGAPSSPRTETRFDKDRGRYVEYTA